jgi:hypothetical protein
MEKEFIPYQTALDLKELGFNQPCFGWWFADEEMLIIEKSTKSTSENIIQAPTFSQAFRWFREVYGLKHDIDDDKIGKKFYYKMRSYTDKFDNYDDIIKPIKEERDWSKIEFYSYEEAELACLIKLIEIVKNSK